MEKIKAVSSWELLLKLLNPIDVYPPNFFPSFDFIKTTILVFPSHILWKSAAVGPSSVAW